MGQHFMVNEFVFFGGLNDTVECHDPTKFRIVEYDDVLMLGLVFEIHFLDTKNVSVSVV
jgi:hypothetical protein